MAKESELYELCDRINLHHFMQGVYLKIEHENDCYYVRIYKGQSCMDTLFGGGTIKEMIESLRAFRKGLLFVNDYADKDRVEVVIK